MPTTSITSQGPRVARPRRARPGQAFRRTRPRRGAANRRRPDSVGGSPCRHPLQALDSDTAPREAYGAHQVAVQLDHPGAAGTDVKPVDVLRHRSQTDRSAPRARPARRAPRSADLRQAATAPPAYQRQTSGGSAVKPSRRRVSSDRTSPIRRSARRGTSVCRFRPRCRRRSAPRRSARSEACRCAASIADVLTLVRSGATAFSRALALRLEQAYSRRDRHVQAFDVPRQRDARQHSRSARASGGADPPLPHRSAHASGPRQVEFEQRLLGASPAAPTIRTSASRKSSIARARFVTAISGTVSAAPAAAFSRRRRQATPSDRAGR